MLNMFPQSWIVTVKLCENCQHPVKWTHAVWSPPYYFCSTQCARSYEAYTNRWVLGPAYEEKRGRRGR